MARASVQAEAPLRVHVSPLNSSLLVGFGVGIIYNMQLLISRATRLAHCSAQHYTWSFPALWFENRSFACTQGIGADPCGSVVASFLLFSERTNGKVRKFYVCCNALVRSEFARLAKH